MIEFLQIALDPLIQCIIYWIKPQPISDDRSNEKEDIDQAERYRQFRSIHFIFSISSLAAARFNGVTSTERLVSSGVFPSFTA